MREQPNEKHLFYNRHVFFCINERKAGHPRGCCADKGSVQLRDYMKQRAKQMGLKGIRINAAGCLDRCELGPSVVIYPEGTWYRCETRGDADEILDTDLRDGFLVKHLLMAPPRRNATE